MRHAYEDVLVGRFWVRHAASQDLFTQTCIKHIRVSQDLNNGLWVEYDPQSELDHDCNDSWWTDVPNLRQDTALMKTVTGGLGSDFFHEFILNMFAVQATGNGNTERICAWAGHLSMVVQDFYGSSDFEIAALVVMATGVANQYQLKLIEKGGNEDTMATLWTNYQDRYVVIYKEGSKLIASAYQDAAHTILEDRAEITLSGDLDFQYVSMPMAYGGPIAIETSSGYIDPVFGSFEQSHGSFNVRRADSEALAAGFTVPYADSADLASKFNAAALNEELPAGFRIKCPRQFGGNWQRKMWFDGSYYWRGRYCPTDDTLKFEYIAAIGLIGNIWTENAAARIDVSGFGGIIADFTVRGGQSGIPTTIHYSDGVDSWVAESDEASATGWIWQNTTKVFDGTAPDYYRMVNLAANRTTPTPRLWAVAVFYDQSEGKQWVKARRQTTGGDITAWDAEVNISNAVNTSTIYGCSVRSMGDAGLLKDDMMVVYKEGVAIRSRYLNGGWGAIQDVDTTTFPGKGAWDFEQGEVAGDNEGHIVYVDADGSVQWRERDSGAAGVWSAAEEVHGAIGHHRGVGIIQHGSGWLWVVWADDTIIEYRLHLCATETWWPLLMNNPLTFDSTTIPPAVVATTWLDGQVQTPDYISAGLAVPVCWVGQTAPGAPCEPGWGILREEAVEDLPATFVVRRSASRDLAASFDAQATQNLPAELVVRQEGSADLLAKFQAAQGDADLLGELIVRHPASQDLAAAFDAQVSLDLFGELSVRRSTQQNVAAEFVVNQSSEDLPAEFIVRGVGADNLPAQFEVIQWLDLSAGFDVRNTTSVTLPAEFIVRHAGSQELAAEFEISFSDGEELLGSFQIRIASDVNEVVIAVNPSAWINYSLGVGTGFLDGPYLGPDNVQKVYGEASLAFLSEYLKNRYDALKFGWKKDDAFTTNMWRTDFCVDDIVFVDRITEHWDWDEQTILSDIIEDTYTRLSWWVPGGNGGWSYANTNYGAQDNLRCSRFYGTPPGSYDQQRDDEEIFIKFSLSGLGVASLERLAYARIELYRYMGDENAKSRLNARRIAECFESAETYIFWNPANRIGGCVNPTPYPWDETSIRWVTTGRSSFTMGGGAPYMGLPSFTNSSPTSRYGLTTDINTWDMIRITDLLEGWLDGSHKNEGLAILAESIDGGDSSREMNTFYTTPRFYSSRAAHANKPQVRLQYIPEDSVGRWSFASPDRWEINITDPHLGTGALHLVDWSKVSYDESRTNVSQATLVTDYTLPEGAITTRFRLPNATYPRLRYAVTPNKYVEYTTPRDNFLNIFLRYQDVSNYYLVQLKPAGENSTIIRRLSAANTTLATFDSGIPAGTDWSKLRIFWAVDNSGTLNICCFVWNTLHAVWKHLVSGADANNYWDTGGDISFSSYDAELDETVISERVI